MLARKSKGIEVKFFYLFVIVVGDFERHDEYRAVQVKPNIEYWVVHMHVNEKRTGEKKWSQQRRRSAWVSAQFDSMLPIKFCAHVY